jgi:RNA polymerase sigma-70 factor (ECF subfamily)
MGHRIGRPGPVDDPARKDTRTTMADEAFGDLIRRVRAGESTAAAELVRQYEPEIRRIVRVRLSNSRLQRLLDSMDICQSVLANFFVRAAAGQWEIESPEDLLKLLATMARNKLRDQLRRQNTQRRGEGQQTTGDPQVLRTLADDAPAPVEHLAVQELHQLVRGKLTEQERLLADRRGHGHGWPEIAAELHEDAEVLRKRLARALDRVSKELGLEP